MTSVRMCRRDVGTRVKSTVVCLRSLDVTVIRSHSSRTGDQWKLRVGRDNHYLDCLVGCAVAASIQGVSTGEQVDVSSRRRPMMKLSDVYKQKRRAIEAAAARR